MIANDILQVYTVEDSKRVYKAKPKEIQCRFDEQVYTVDYNEVSSGTPVDILIRRAPASPVLVGLACWDIWIWNPRLLCLQYHMARHGRF